MKKIFVQRNESVEELVEKIISAEEEEIILIIPRASGVAGTVSNFDLIKRESESAGKKIFVESVDEHVLALARSVRIEALHSLFDGPRRSVLSDIVSVKTEDRDFVPEKRVNKKSRRQKQEKESKSGAGGKKEESDEPHIYIHRKEIERTEYEEQIEEEESAGSAPGETRRKFIIVGVLLGLVFLIGGGVWVTNKVFGTANVVIHFKEAPWAYEHSFFADTSASGVDESKYILPGQLFTPEVNKVFPFPATGMKNVSEKAAGTITIYNAYSSASQILVASTRFETPDGKTFRITSQTVVPGAEIKDGKIIPATVQAAIVADAPGSGYNVGPVPRLTIPGFKGSPKFGGFYGEIVKPTKGGFVGQKKVPTAADIQDAKDKATDVLKTVLETNLIAGYPQDFTQFDSAREFKITKLSANENTDENGNFSVFGEAQISTIGFRETDMSDLLNSIAIDGDTTLTVKDLSIDYQDIKSDIAKGKLSFTVSASGTLTTNFSPDDFRAKLIGRTIDEVRFLTSQLPGLSDAKISVWPMWLRHVPSSEDRIKISTE